MSDHKIKAGRRRQRLINVLALGAVGIMALGCASTRKDAVPTAEICQTFAAERGLIIEVADADDWIISDSPRRRVTWLAAGARGEVICEIEQGRLRTLSVGGTPLG